MTTEAIEKAEKKEITETEHTRNVQHYRPNVDIVEQADELTVVADMPGVNRDNIDIDFENGMLTIRGRLDRAGPDGMTLVSSEYGVGDFYRTFQVSEKIDGAKITAEFTDGVLRLHLPKVDQVKPRKIAVQAN